MKTFTYTVKDAVGIHARPAGLIVTLAKNYESDIIVEKGGKGVSAKKLMALMSLGVKCGETVIVRVEGKDEAAASTAIEEFFKTNL